MEQTAKFFVSVLLVSGLVMSVFFMIDLFGNVYQVISGNAYNAEFRKWF